MNYKVDSTVQSTLFVFFKHLVITVKIFTRILYTNIENLKASG